MSLSLPTIAKTARPIHLSDYSGVGTMDLAKLVICMIVFLIISTPGSAEWKDTTTKTAEVTAGDEAYLESGVKTDLIVDAQNPGVLKSKTTSTYLTGKDIYSANLASTEDFTVTDEDGVVHNYATATKQYITLPASSAQSDEGYDIDMAGYSFYDFSDRYDIMSELGFGLSITDPETSDSELDTFLALNISADDSPTDLINKFMASFGESGLGSNIDSFLEPNNLMYGAEFERPNSESKNGVTCNWGDSQKVSIDYAWLNGIGGES